jgi:hypothetical protein
MAQTVSKISLVSPGMGSPQEEKSQRSRQIGLVQETSGSFKKYAIQRPVVTAMSPVISPAQHQAVRRQVFRQLVRRVLNEKSHPFSRLDTELKQDMINSITEELVQSHYRV